MSRGCPSSAEYAALLLLFDIDGTLVQRASEAHAAALHAALREVHGVQAGEQEPGFSPAGRTDGEIARHLLLGAGLSPGAIDDGAEAVRTVCAREYAQRCPASLAGTLVPGIEALLDWLQGRDDVALALVTGNFEPVARLKLDRAGVGHHFAAGQGGFGSDSEDRGRLPGIARGRAGQDGSPHPREDTVIIGDTPRDIACARADGVRCVAVTTGPFAASELLDADEVADGTAQLRTALERLLDRHCTSD